MTVKLTLKQLMLIIMSVLLVLTVAMTAIVFAKVGDMMGSFGGASMNNPPVGDPTGTQSPTRDEGPEPSESQEATKPKETDPNHEHEYKKSQTLAATCTDMGYTIYMCSCGKSDIRDFHDARGHNYGDEELLEATCGKPGYRQATCLRCGAVDTREVFDALEHDYELVREQELTCEQDGFQEYKCKHCDDVKRENEEEAQGHKWKEPSQLVTEPTDVKPGEEKKTCEVCNGTESVLIPPTGNLKVRLESLPSEVGKWTEYTFYVGTETNKSAYIYRIWIAAEHSDLQAVFSATGLTVTYEDAAGQKQQYILEPYSNEILTIAEDGTPSSEAPDLTQDPTGEPTEEPTEEPTGEPTEEPTEGTTEGTTEGQEQDPAGNGNED